MAYDVSNFLDNDDVSVIAERGPFKVIQYDRDLSCTPEEAMTKYYMSQMYVTKKQLVCDTDKASVILSPGKMQLGNSSPQRLLESRWSNRSMKDLDEWGGSVTVDDGLFYACEGSTKIKTVARSTVSSAVMGGEGLFNTCLVGHGVVALECRCPEEELIEITLNNDTIRIDGNYAIAWSEDLRFTVEKSGKSLLGSAVSGEGFVNVYSGTGRVLLMPQV